MPAAPSTNQPVRQPTCATTAGTANAEISMPKPAPPK
jgi:hypothetical protein